MTSFLNTLSRQSVAFAGGHTAVHAPNRTASTSDTEYQAVFATIVLLLAGGAAVVMTALAHNF